MAVFARGTHFAGHVILGLLGAGSVAEVYEVIAPAGRRRALKVIRADIALASKPQARLGLECDVIASIEHLNVVRFYDSGIEDGRLWILLELVEGPNLRQLVSDAGGALPLLRAVSIVHQACQGVAAAHALKILHRDLKPENILVAADDVAKVADFGSAKVAGLGVHTTDQQEIDASLYRAPERFRLGGVAEERSDVYAMAVLLYEIVAGVHPIVPGPASPIQICARHLWHQPPPLATLPTLADELPTDLSALLEQAMAKAPAQRPFMPDFVAALGGILRRLHGPRRAQARRVPLPDRELGLAPTELKMAAVAPGGTVRLEAFLAEVESTSGSAPWTGRSAVPMSAPLGSAPISAPPPATALPPSGAPTRRSRIEMPVMTTGSPSLVDAAGERASTTAPVERAARASRVPRAVPAALGGVGAVLLLGAAGLGWMVFGPGRAAPAPVSAATVAPVAVVPAAPSVVTPAAPPAPATSTSAARGKPPPRRPAAPRRERLPF